MIRTNNPRPKRLLWSCLALTLTFAACTKVADEGASQLPLPEFTDCVATEPPDLPAKWEATAVMQSFFKNEIVFGKFVYDDDAEAFRFALKSRYGLDYDFLVTADRRLYLLRGGAEPTSCTYLTGQSPYTVPSREWVGSGAKCVGEAPILAKDQQWWKNPSGDVGANWFWFNVGDRLPFRSMYYADAKPTTPVPIYEHFTFNYFPSFREVESTDLSRILQMCRSSSEIAVASEEYSAHSIEPLLEMSTFPETSEEQIATIQEWIPGLSECSSIGDLPPPWPTRVQGSVFMTAVSFEPNPFPTRVFYDFTRPAQNTTLYTYPPDVKEYSQTALLTGNTGYIYFSQEDGKVTECHQALPGPQVPNWKPVDGCQCRAQIAPNTVLNPTDVPTKILWCPTDLSAQQVFWTWYSDIGSPVVFMQSNSSPTDGTGLNLADYYHWQPGSVAPGGTFDLPALCDKQPKDDVPKACHNCHLPLNSGQSAGG